MKKLLFSGFVLVLLIVGCLFAYRYYEANKGFSPWLARDGFEQWHNENVKHHPLYISAVEGRLNNGVEEWRIRPAPKPQGVTWYWYWYYGLGQESYDAHVADLVEQRGFKQIWAQSYLDAKNEKKYQVVFMKTFQPGEEDTEAARKKKPAQPTL